MFLRRLFLFPFAVLYDLITRLRNQVFDLGLKPSASFDIPVISVGNLSVGGTGKTPMVEYLIRLLSSHQKIATLSRGYGRNTKGMRIANAMDTASTVGDEPFQLYKKFKENLVVSVCEERVFAIPHLIDQFPDLRVILLDDAFQHRFVKPGFSMLLTDYSKPFYQDFLLPAGNLRVARIGVKRADIIIVTKCPQHLSDEEMMGMEHTIRRYTDNPIFFSKIRYGTPVSFSGARTLEHRKVILLSGIANPKPLENYVKENFEMVKHLIYPDHYTYTDADMLAVVTVANQVDASILTTDKDKAKLEVLANRHNVLAIFSMPIEFEFLKSGSDFDAMLLEYVNHASASTNG